MSHLDSRGIIARHLAEVLEPIVKRWRRETDLRDERGGPFGAGDCSGVGGCAAYDADADRKPIPPDRDDPAPTGVRSSTSVDTSSRTRRLSSGWRSRPTAVASAYYLVKRSKSQSSGTRFRRASRSMRRSPSIPKKARAGMAGAGRLSRRCRVSLTSRASARASSSGEDADRRPYPVAMYHSPCLGEYRPYLTVRQKRPTSKSRATNTGSVELPSDRQWRSTKAGAPPPAPLANMTAVARSSGTLPLGREGGIFSGCMGSTTCGGLVRGAVHVPRRRRGQGPGG